MSTEMIRFLKFQTLTTGSILLCVATATAPAADRPEIVSRDAWKAKPALKTVKMKPHTPQSIMIHHTAVRQNRKRDVGYKMRSLQAFSQSTNKLASGKVKPAWGDVPYHFYIGVSGRIAEGRSLGFAGDTNTGYPTEGHIQIVVEGNFQKDTPTGKQLASMSALVRWLAAERGIPAKRIFSHQDHAGTLCPGEHLLPHVESLKSTSN